MIYALSRPIARSRSKTMNTKQWDKDIDESLKQLRIANEEVIHHLYNLWSLSGGKIGKRPPEGETGV